MGRFSGVFHSIENRLKYVFSWRRQMSEPQKNRDQSTSQQDLIKALVKDEDVEKKIIDIDPVTLVVIVTLVLLVPLLITGFISH